MPPVDLPRGNAKAAPRVAVQAPTLPPIVLAPAPPARSYAPQAAARAYVAAPHHYTAPYVPPPQLAPKTAVQAARAQKSSASNKAPAPPVLSNSERLARVIAAITRDAINRPLRMPPAAGSPLMTGPIRQMMYQGLLAQQYQRLQKQGLLPPGAHMPALSFPDSMSMSPGAAAYETGGSGPNSRISVSQGALSAATDPKMTGAFGFGQEVPLHELAHAMQSARTLQSVPLREGGAQAYADAVAPAVAGPIVTDDGSYAGYVNRVRKRGPAWYMRGQFG